MCVCRVGVEPGTAISCRTWNLEPIWNPPEPGRTSIFFRAPAARAEPGTSEPRNPARYEVSEPGNLEPVEPFIHQTKT